MASSSRYEIAIVNELPGRIVLNTIRMALDKLLTMHDCPPTQVSVLISDDARLRELNLAHRGIDAPTDVLTFPAPAHLPILGDIAISIDFARRQARKRGVRVRDELAMLAIHGGLHLLGMEDETDDGRDAMVNRMNEVVSSIGLPTDKGWSSLPHGETA